jgi:hypothetical protein
MNIIRKFSSFRKGTQPVSITKIAWLMLFKEIIAVYSENRVITTLFGQTAEFMIVKSGAYIYHWVLKD